LRAALDDRARDPYESNAKESAKSHAKLRVAYEETREETREKEDGEERANEKKDVIAALNEDVAGAAAEESRDFEDTVLNDSVGEGKRIEKNEERKRIVEPRGGLVAKQVSRDAFENDGNDAHGGPPKHDARFAAGIYGGFPAHRIQKKRNYGEKKQGIGNCEPNIVGGAVTENLGKRVRPVEISCRQAGKRLTETEEQCKPF